MQEGARVQGLQIAEGGRTQGLGVAGKQFMFNAQENREGAQLDRVSAQIAGAEARQAQASADRTGAITGAIGGISSIVGGALTSGAFTGSSAATSTTGFTDAVNNNNAFSGYDTSPTTFPSSDRRLKKNIKLIGYSPKGLKIYAFEYIDNKLGEGVFQGVMSDEIPNEAVVKNSDGFDRVNYSKLDVEFKLIK